VIDDDGKPQRIPTAFRDAALALQASLAPR